MTKGIFIGEDNTAARVWNVYIGIEGKACRVKNIYLGVNGVAELVWGSDPSQELITFKIGSTTYTAIDNMTWDEWVASAYNTAGFVLSGRGYVTLDGDYVALSDETYVEAEDLIRSGYNYIMAV